MVGFSEEGNEEFIMEEGKPSQRYDTIYIYVVMINLQSLDLWFISKIHEVFKSQEKSSKFKGN